MGIYKFDAQEAYELIARQWIGWMKTSFAREKKIVIGLSGGKDSSVVAGLAVQIFGKENVLGVRLPNGEQPDINYSKEIADFLGIESIEINIKDSVNGITNEMLDVFRGNISEQTKINLPARIRMATLYAVAQTVDGIVPNTCNLSEDMIGYATLWGDNVGSYAPICQLTVKEVIELGRYLGIPEKFLIKPPSDGLCGKTDEDNLGFTYAELDDYIRNGNVNLDLYFVFKRKYKANKFKLDMLNLPHPTIPLPNYFLIEMDKED